MQLTADTPVHSVESTLKDLRILVVMPSVPLHGMERANTQIMRLLRRAGANVLFVAEPQWGFGVVDAIESAECEWVGIDLPQQLVFPTNPSKFFQLARNWRRTYSSIRKIFEAYEPTHIYLTNVSYFLYCLPLTGTRSAKTIFRLPNPPESGISGPKQRIWNWLWQRAIIPRCDTLVCNSRYTQEKLRALAGPDSRIELIYNTLPVHESTTVSDAPQISRSRFNVVYLGRIQRRKGVEHLYEAARSLVKQYENVDFYLAGQYSWKNPFAEALVLENERAGLSERIRFLDHIVDTPGLLERADLHVCPSTSASESFPNVVLEAKNAGVPSVVFPTAGLPEAVVDESEGLVCSGTSAVELAEKIERYVLDPDLCRRHGERARESLKRHDENSITAEWIRVLTDG